MKYFDKKIKANTTIKVDNLTSASRFMKMAIDNGGIQFQDVETRQKGGRKYDMNGEIIYIYMM